MNIELTAITHADLATLNTWIHTNTEMIRWSGPWNFTFPLDVDQLSRFFLAGRTGEGLRRMQFMAIDEETKEIVGQIGFSRIWDATNAAHVGPLIVAPHARRRGVGLQMLRQLVRFGFQELHFHRIELVVFTFNEAAVACYEKVGFQREGVMRDIVCVGGEYWHWHIMSILASEWNG